MKIIPAIDIIDGRCVRLTQGDYRQKKVYSENPLEVARQVQAAGLTHLHVVDLDGAKTGAVKNWKTIETLTQNTNLLIDVGGGIKTYKDLQLLFELGAQQVNLGSIAAENPAIVREWLQEFGNNKIIISADVRENKIAWRGWQKQSKVTIYNFIQLFEQNQLVVTCTDISADGTLSGPNISLYKSVREKFPEVRLIASGGVSSINDLALLQELKVEGVIIGKAIYENRITLAELAVYVN
jgi:phosphoribosylformimino-5-aminoimidazole carboxamide ribotide isomerase